MASRSALIIASYEFADKGLSQLVAPAQDAKALARVLGDPAIGQFEVKTLVNEPSHRVGSAIEAFFDNRKRDDLLLLYYSGHGIKDEAGRLYFSTPDTHRRRLRFTAVPANSVNDIMMHSRSRRQVMLLDCCFSGAFAKGMVAKAEEAIGATVGTNEQLGGRGRVVLTASDALQYAFEGDEVTGSGTRSFFTEALVHGLETGVADSDDDGIITIDELYDYVHDQVTGRAPQQRPEKWELGIQGNIMIALNPQPSAPQVSLPGWVTIALTNPDFSARIVAVGELRKLLQADDEAVANLAFTELERLAKEDVDSTVRGAAQGTLETASSVSARTTRPTSRLRTVKARPEPQPELHSSLALSLSVDPGTVDIGNEVKWTATVRNGGDDPLRQVTLKREGSKLGKPFDLAIGKTRRLTFASVYESKGTRTITVTATGLASDGKRVRDDASATVQVREILVRQDADDVLERFRVIVSEFLGLEPSEVTPDARFVEDLGMDSLDCVELVMAFEEEFEIDISDEDAERYMVTVGETVKFLRRKVPNAR